nr:TrbI/VirB10 family protein [Ralstonia syzygii]
MAFGQERVLVAWSRLQFPNGSTLNLEGMTGGDAGGYAGFHDQVNNHYGRLIGFGIGTALFSAAFQLSQPQQSSTNGTLSAQQTTAQQRSGSSSRSLACKSLLGT